MVEGSFRPSRDSVEPFDSRSSCLGWVISHPSVINRAFPGVPVRPVALERWLLGLD